MKKYIKVYDDVLTKKTCSLLIDRFEKSTKKKVSDKVRSFTELNISKDDTWANVMKSLFGVLRIHVDKYRLDCPIHPYQFPDKFGFEELRFKRYLPNDKEDFKEHVDVTDYRSAKRFLVMFLYLNDNPAGQTSFPHYDMKVQPKAGRLLMFPSVWTFLHAGLKPLETPKYIAGSYLHYL